MMQKFADAHRRRTSRFEPYYGGNLFKQGTELVALQRGNLEMGNIAPQDIANQVPEFSILTAAYVFRDADHMRAFFASDFGKEMVGRAEEQLGIKILGPTYFGTRQVGLKPEKEIKTPADMAGIKLRMPGGDAWQFLGQALGANPTPMAYAEVYTGLQTGAIDGQDNPLPNVAEHEVLRGDEPDRADLAPRRLRPADHLQDRLGRDDARAAGEGAGGGDRGDRLEPGRAPEAGGRARQVLRGEGAEDLRPRRRRLPRPTPRRCTSSPTSRRAGPRGCSTRSTASAPDADDAGRGGSRSGSTASRSSSRRCCSPRCSSPSWRRSSSATCSTSRSAGPRSSPSSPGSGWCSGAPPSWSPRPRRSAST